VVKNEEIGAIVSTRPSHIVCPVQHTGHGILGRGPKEIPNVPSVEERVIDIVCENLGVNKEQVTRQTSFIDDVGADSLDIVELVMELEEEFEITIPDDQAEKIKTVGEAIDYIEREQAKK